MHYNCLLLSFAIFAGADAALTQVTDFGSNPAGIQMWIEVPSNVANKAPLIVAVSNSSLRFTMKWLMSLGSFMVAMVQRKVITKTTHFQR